MLGLQKSNMFLLKHFDGNFPINIEKMMYYEGVIFDKSKDLDDVIATVNPDISAIQISKSIPKEIEKFVISYCLGSLMIEKKRKNVKLRDLSYKKDNKNHNESLIFAMNLSMPESKFKTYYKTVSKDPQNIAKRFDSSIYLVNTRIRQLNLS